MIDSEIEIKRIAIIGTVGIPAKYGGFETLIENLTYYLAKDFDMTVYCSSKAYDEKLETYNNAKLEYIDLDANGVHSILYDIISLLKAKDSEVILVLGVSGCIFLPVLKMFSKAKIVVNIDGLEWKREKWSKFAKLFLKFSEKMAIKYSDAVVTDNKVIQDHVIDTYEEESTLIAYGADHVEKIALSDEVLNQYPYLNEKYAFSVCRIEPENNLHIILEAFSQQNTLPLVIIGNWKANKYGLELLEKYATIDHIYLLDPIYDQKILDQIRSNAYVYMHGHSAGGTNPSLVEAMFLELPIFAYGVNYNKETTENCAAYFLNSMELQKLIKNIDDDYLESISENMLEISNRRYRWSFVSDKYSQLFS
jgi:glycosyltransferase involved in cell wall biosynthesis